MKVRIGTFNAENLFVRFSFRPKRVRQPDGTYKTRPYTYEELQALVNDGWDVNGVVFRKFDDVGRGLTGAAIKGINADILGLQEVENLDVLKRFNSQRLWTRKPKRYTYKLVIDGNDPRLIDVAVLSRYPFEYIRTHQFQRTSNNRAYVFSRDCLEVGVRISQNTVLPVFVNHFKSMMGGRDQTMARRKIQAEAVVALLKKRFGINPGNEAWVVIGDLNDYMPSPGLSPLLSKNWLENVVDRIPNPNDRWTHYWKGGKEYRQLDYILLSKALADANPNALPEIERRGMPTRADRYTGTRFSGVGKDKPKASDHCPLVVEVDV